MAPPVGTVLHPANLPIEAYEEELAKYPTGVYYGWGCVPSRDNGKVHKAAMSIGLNPYYKNTCRTIVSVKPTLTTR